MLGVKNRFAGLKIDDDEDEPAQSRDSASNQNQSNAAAKKKNKKKKKDDEALRSMAFGMARPGGKPPKQGGSGHQRGQGNKQGKVEDWEEWQKRDMEATEDMYQRDLQQALLDSKLEAEQQKQTQKLMEAQQKALGVSSDRVDSGKKKKKKDKPHTMSLDQFNQLPPERVPGSDEEEEVPSPPPVHTRVPVSCQDTQYFDSVASDASRILQKERIQEQYQKAYAHESAMQSKYQEEIEKMSKKMEELTATLEEERAELKTVKKRNTTLCKLLAQGEMKDKAAVLMQVEELTTVKDELTEQVSTLTAELEKERSKNHALKLENEKMKGKHGK